MAREDLHFRLRIPQDLKARIEANADLNERSMTAEIIARLYESVNDDSRARTMALGMERLQEQVAEQEKQIAALKLLQDSAAGALAQYRDTISTLNNLVEAKEETQSAMRDNIRLMQLLIVNLYDALDQAAAGDTSALDQLVETHKKTPTRNDSFFQEMRELLKQDKK